jgi:hypothetical protein
MANECCFHHGGATPTGRTGKAHNRYQHGHHTRVQIAERRAVRELMRDIRASLAEVKDLMENLG